MSVGRWLVVKVRFEGGRELERALLELKGTTAKGVVRRVLKKVAQPIADKANANAPEAEGDLNKSYVVGTRLNKRQRRAARNASRDDVTVYVGTNNPAGVQQEFGNAKHSAQPHFRPAWDAEKTGLVEKIGQSMRVEVEKAAARARRKAARSK